MKDQIQLFSSGVPDLVLAEGIETRHRFVRHSHDFTVIGIFTRGSQMSRYGMHDYELSAGDVVFVPPGEIHDGRPNGGKKDPFPRSYKMAYVSFGLMSELKRTCWIPDDADNNLQVARMVFSQNKMVFHAATHFLRSAAAADGITDELVLAFGQLAKHISFFDTPIKLPEVAQKAQRRLNEGANSITGLAEEFNVSRYALLRSFKSAYGLTPSEYRRQRRIEQSLPLFVGASSLTDIALECGFSDQSHFVREFKAVFGLTPGAYRRVVA